MMPSNRLVAGALGLSLLMAGATPAQAMMPPRHGRFPAEVSSALRSGLLTLPAPALRPRAGTAGAEAVMARTLWRVPVVLVSFSDSALTNGAAAFNSQLFDTTGSSATGSVYDYYQWASNGALRVIPTVVATVTVPHTRDYYGAGAHGINSTATPRNDAGLVMDLLQQCAQSVDWTRFDLDRDGYVDMLWVVHAGVGGEGTPDADLSNLWSVTTQLSGYWSGTQPIDVSAPGGPHTLIDRFTILPELSLLVPNHISEIGAYCHEFGHALGLPDLYDTIDPYQRDTGPGNWSLMSTGAYGGDNLSPQYPVHPGAWCSLFLGWTQSFRPARDTLVSLAPIAHGGSILELWFQGEYSPEHFLVESRRREGFDRNLPAEGLMVYHVDEALIGLRILSNRVNTAPNPAMIVVEADGRSDLLQGWDHGDATDPFPGGLSRSYLLDEPSQPSTVTFGGAPTNIGLLDIMATPAGGSCQVQVRAPGWQPATDQSGGTFRPLGGFGVAQVAVVDPSGSLAAVVAENRGGHSQIILRTRMADVWQPPIQVSQSPGDALDPSIALLPGGDLAVAWSDSRAGHSHIYYRARVRGSWGPERAIENLPGQNYTPAIGADGQGTVQVAWSYFASGHYQILLERFGYLSPFGQAMAVTGATSAPGSPGLAVASDGSSYIMWADQATTPQSIRYAQFDPRTGLSRVDALTSPPGMTQQSPYPMVDNSGTLHVVWLVSGPGVNEVHYQMRPAGAAPWPNDARLESSAGAVQNARLAADSLGGIHLVYQSLISGVNQIRYLPNRPGRGWDARSTEVTSLADGTAQRAVALATAPGSVTVIYTGYPDGQPHFMERRRLTDTSGPLAVEGPPPLVLEGLRIGPNPLRAGQALRVSWAGRAIETQPAVEFFDLAGRRLASLALVPTAPGFGGALSPAITTPWPSGIYFARVRGSSENATRIVFLR